MSRNRVRFYEESNLDSTYNAREGRPNSENNPSEVRGSEEIVSEKNLKQMILQAAGLDISFKDLKETEKKTLMDLEYNVESFMQSELQEYKAKKGINNFSGRRQNRLIEEEFKNDKYDCLLEEAINREADKIIGQIGCISAPISMGAVFPIYPFLNENKQSTARKASYAVLTGNNGFENYQKYGIDALTILNPASVDFNLARRTKGMDYMAKYITALAVGISSDLLLTFSPGLINPTVCVASALGVITAGRSLYSDLCNTESLTEKSKVMASHIGLGALSLMLPRLLSTPYVLPILGLVACQISFMGKHGDNFNKYLYSAASVSAVTLGMCYGMSGVSVFSVSAVQGASKIAELYNFNKCKELECSKAQSILESRHR